MVYENSLRFIADIHYKEKTLEYLKTPMDEFIADLKKNKPLITVIGGDYFDKRLGAEEEAYKTAIDNIVKMSEHTKHLIFIKGTYSHDYDTLEIINTLQKLKSNIYYYPTLKEVELEGLKILIVPEEYPVSPENYYKEAFSKKYDLVLGHGDIQGAMLHSGINNTMLKGFRFNLKELSEMAKFVLFGHIHKHQYLKDNVVYPGSLARYKQGEEEDKGYLSLDLDNFILEFKKVNAVIFKSIIIKTDEEYDKYKELLLDENVEVSIKLSKEMSHIKKDIEHLNPAVNISNLKSLEDDTKNVLLYEDIDKLDIVSQYKLILSKDNVPKSKRLFFTDEEMELKIAYLNNAIS